MSRETYEERRERERRDPDLNDSWDRGPGHETSYERDERYRREWAREIDRDLEDGR